MELSDMQLADTSLTAPGPYRWNQLVSAYEALTEEYRKATCAARAWAWGEWEMALAAKERARQLTLELAALNLEMRGA